MESAWIVGKPAALDVAIAEAAKIIAASNQALITGLGTDVAGARAAIALAERSGAIIDHKHAESVLRDLEVAYSTGVMMTTPTEAQVRADVFLLAGPGLGAGAIPQPTLSHRHKKDSIGKRRIFWLCPGRGAAAALASRGSVKIIGRAPHELPAVLAALRARVAGRLAGKAPISTKLLDEISNNLKAVRFGVVTWSAAALDALTIEMLCGLINDLNATTRFAALPLAPEDNALGILHVCGWMTGYPMRTGFGRGYPQHDPWLLNTRRLVDSGEADCVIWISAYSASFPQWPRTAPVIALAPYGTRFSVPPDIHIAVGCPGLDHPGIQYSSSTGALTAVAVAQPSNAIPVAEVLTRIAAVLPDDGAPRC